jgi:hypothetical protein
MNVLFLMITVFRNKTGERGQVLDDYLIISRIFLYDFGVFFTSSLNFLQNSFVIRKISVILSLAYIIKDF